MTCWTIPIGSDRRIRQSASVESLAKKTLPTGLPGSNSAWRHYDGHLSGLGGRSPYDMTVGVDFHLNQIGNVE